MPGQQPGTRARCTRFEPVPSVSARSAMDPVTAARREVALDIQRLAEEFERSDEAALYRTRLGCWVVTVLVTILALAVLMMGGDRRYLGLFWVAMVGLTWAGYALSSFRQRRQTSQLRALANRWLAPTPSGP